MRFILFVFIYIISLNVSAQCKRDAYPCNWITDIPIWYNCGGYRSLLNYQFKGSAEIAINDDHGYFKYKIENGILIEYSFRNFDKCCELLFEPHGAAAYFSAFATVNRHIGTIKHLFSFESGTGVRSYITKCFSVNDDIIHAECSNGTGQKIYSYELNMENDGYMSDTLAVYSPYYIFYSMLNSFKYRVAGDSISIRMTTKDIVPQSLSLKKDPHICVVYKKGVPQKMIKDDDMFLFRCIKRDKKGNWLKLECYDVRKKRVTNTISRTIWYL